MFKENLEPRFCDTDALGHINNTSYLEWFEGARRPLFKIFVPDLDPKKWNLIIARIELDFLAQGEFEKEIEIHTGVDKIGNSSFQIIQTAKQAGIEIAKCRSFMIHFDYKANKSIPLTNDIKDKLENI